MRSYYSSKINALYRDPQKTRSHRSAGMPKTRNFVMAGLTKNPRLNEAKPKAIRKPGPQDEWDNEPLTVRGSPD
jgi:hypothetical protein